MKIINYFFLIILAITSPLYSMEGPIDNDEWPSSYVILKQPEKPEFKKEIEGFKKEMKAKMGDCILVPGSPRSELLKHSYNTYCFSQHYPIPINATTYFTERLKALNELIEECGEADKLKERTKKLNEEFFKPGDDYNQLDQDFERL